MKSMLVIGMGRFGQYLAKKLLDLGNDVMIIDRDESLVEQLAPEFTNAQIGDCTNASVLKAIGAENFDVCFVAIDENFQASLEISSLLSEMGAKCVVSKASRDMQAKFLLKNGANEVVYPERDMAEKLAIKYSSNNVFDYIELSNDVAIFEISIADGWVGKTIESLAVRRKYNLNILAIRVPGTEEIIIPSPDYVFNQNEHIIVLGKNDTILKFANKVHKIKK